MKRLRILVVDDSAVVRRIVTEMIESDPELEVVDIAPNGRIAVEKVRELSPDAVTLDIEMPVLDGLGALEEIRRFSPTLPVIMFSTLTDRGTSQTLRALFLGATDYALKPTGTGALVDGSDVRGELVRKIRAACGRDEVARATETITSASAPAAPLGPRGPRGPIEIVAIGTSTGGPAALNTVVEGVRRDFSVPIVVVQHMPPRFTAMLAEQLDRKTELHVHEAADGDVLTAGGIWIAPGDRHLSLRRGARGLEAHVHDGEKENSCRPAVDVLFRSVAKSHPGGTLAVVLTGMGADGLRGAQAIRAAGGEIWAQDRETSVVWGMPGEICRAEIADRTLPLAEVSRSLNARVRPRALGADRRVAGSGNRP